MNVCLRCLLPRARDDDASAGEGRKSLGGAENEAGLVNTEAERLGRRKKSSEQEVEEKLDLLLGEDPVQTVVPDEGEGKRAAGSLRTMFGKQILVVPSADGSNGLSSGLVSHPVSKLALLKQENGERDERTLSDASNVSTGSPLQGGAPKKTSSRASGEGRFFGFLRTFDENAFDKVGFFDCMDNLQEGDIVLFRTKSFASKIQRTFVHSGGFDHIGIIVTCDDCCDDTCCPLNLKETRKAAGVKSWHTLEADSNGVSLYRFTPSCLGAYNGVICIRHLLLDPTYFPDEKRTEMNKRLSAFVSQMNGRPYETSMLQMFRAANIFGHNEVEDLSSVFCSELVAAAYMQLGLVDSSAHNRRTSNSYIPGDFASKNALTSRAIKLVKGAVLSSESVIDCDNMRLDTGRYDLRGVKSSRGLTDDVNVQIQSRLEKAGSFDETLDEASDEIGALGIPAAPSLSPRGIALEPKVEEDKLVSQKSLTRFYHSEVPDSTVANKRPMMLRKQETSVDVFAKFVVKEKLDVKPKNRYRRQSSVLHSHSKPLHITELNSNVITAIQELRMQEKSLEEEEPHLEITYKGSSELRRSLTQHQANMSASCISEFVHVYPDRKHIQLFYAKGNASVNFNFSVIGLDKQGKKAETIKHCNIDFSIIGPIGDGLIAQLRALGKDPVVDDDLDTKITKQSEERYSFAFVNNSDVVFDTLTIDKVGWYQLRWDNVGTDPCRISFLCHVK
mmetsp:Transcript_7012/g.11130  ORF Transcript_7012/g.11130 Transcript_7012/m.11130 type:complete len:730 (+) Transcript_7012:278-2467(+)